VQLEACWLDGLEPFVPHNNISLNLLRGDREWLSRNVWFTEQKIRSVLLGLFRLEDRRGPDERQTSHVVSRANVYGSILGKYEMNINSEACRCAFPSILWHLLFPSVRFVRRKDAGEARTCHTVSRSDYSISRKWTQQSVKLSIVESLHTSALLCLLAWNIFFITVLSIWQTVFTRIQKSPWNVQIQLIA
jgi:hypothetical protein